MLCESPLCIRGILGHLRALKYEVSTKYHSHKLRTDRRYSDHDSSPKYNVLQLRPDDNMYEANDAFFVT